MSIIRLTTSEDSKVRTMSQSNSTESKPTFQQLVALKPKPSTKQELDRRDRRSGKDQW